MKRLAFLGFLTCLLSAQTSMVLGNLAEITGDGATHAFSSTATARWVQIVAPTANSAAIRIGGASTNSTTGIPVAPGAGFMLPSTTTNAASQYIIGSIYYYAGVGDKVNIMWGN